jgi:hypothetical protein
MGCVAIGVCTVIVVAIMRGNSAQAATVPGSQYIAPSAWTEVPVYDTAWQMLSRASTEQADEYFEALKVNGFTGTWAGVLHHAPGTHEHTYNGGGKIGSIIDGEIVLSGGFVENTTAILDVAHSHGMKVGLVVAWQNLYLPGGGADNGSPVSDLVRGTLTVDNAAAYGEQMVELFGDHPAVSMWVFGGDAGTNNTEENIEVWRVMAAAVKAAGSTLEITYHTPTSHFDQLNYAGEEWLDFIAPETGHGQDATETEAELIAAANAYQIPVWQGEPRYFNINFNWVNAAFRDPGVDEVEADAQAARNAGVGGYVYGDAGRWNWCQGWGDSSPCDPDEIADSFGAGEAAVIAVFANPACGGQPCVDGDGVGGSVSYGTPPQSGWGGFEVSEGVSGVGEGLSPGWGLGVTQDLGGDGTDVWVNNHALQSEAIIDAGTAEQAIGLAADYGASPFVDTHGVAFGDIDGDGDEDLLEISGRNSPNRLFRNDGGTLVPLEPGPLQDFLAIGQQAVFVDFDGDGDMDVVTVNQDLREPPVNLTFNAPSAVYLNDGTGTEWTKLDDPNGLLSNGNRSLTQLTSTGPGTDPIVLTHNESTVGLDSFATGSALTASATPATQRSSTHVNEVIVADFDNDLHPELLVVRGDDTDVSGDWPLQLFDIVQDGSPVAVPELPVDPLIDNCRSAAAADFDNDGDIDILAGCAHRQQGQLRNIVLVNDGGGQFSIGGVELLEATSAETPAAMVTADLNDDGWVDAWVSNGYDFDNARDQVLGNRGGTNNWLTLDLVGSNPDAVGAQVFVGTDVWQVRETGHRFHRNQDMRDLHFGLGDASAVANLLVRWPDGSFETCAPPALNQRLRLEQGVNGCTTMEKTEFLAALAVAPRDPEPSVVINEIHYSPAAGGVEFIELHNIGNASVDLQGFELAGIHTFVTGSSVAVDGFVVVTADLALFQTLYPGVPALEWDQGVLLEDDGQRIVLTSAAGLIVDEVSYGDGVNDPIVDDADEPVANAYTVAQVIDGTIGAGDGANPNEQSPMGLHDAPLYLPQGWDWAQGSIRNNEWGTLGTGSSNYVEFRCAVFPELNHEPSVPFRINVRNAAYWQFGDAGWTKGFDVDLQPGNGAYLGTPGELGNPFNGPGHGTIQWRQEADGSFSAPWNADALMMHFWADERQAPSTGQTAEFTTSEVRLQQPDGQTVDLSSVRVLFQCGVDYYETTGGQGNAVPGPGIGTYHLATSQWSPSLWVTLPPGAAAESVGDFEFWLQANLPPGVEG